MTVAALLQRILSVLSQVLGIADQIRSLLGLTATSTDLVPIQESTSVTLADVESAVYGLQKIDNDVLGVKDDIAALQSLMVDLFTDITDGSTPVSLPTTPPTGYGGASAADTSESVWSYTRNGWTFGSFGYIVDKMYDMVFNSTRGTAILQGQNPNVYLYGPWDEQEGVPATDYPIFDLANVLITDDLGTFLFREDVGHDWGPSGAFPGFYTAISTADVQWIWICAIPVALFHSVVLDVLGSTITASAPLWPGLANVTLGTPVALAPGVTITEPMDGVIIAITDEPAKAGWFTFDDVRSYRNLGAISFVSDNGDQEPPQNLGFTQEVYVPRTMVQASGVKVRAVGGVEGTVTPWVRS